MIAPYRLPIRRSRSWINSIPRWQWTNSLIVATQQAALFTLILAAVWGVISLFGDIIWSLGPIVSLSYFSFSFTRQFRRLSRQRARVAADIATVAQIDQERHQLAAAGQARAERDQERGRRRVEARQYQHQREDEQCRFAGEARRAAAGQPQNILFSRRRQRADSAASD
jgi:hypothetical protein